MSRLVSTLLLFCWLLMPRAGSAQVAVPEAETPSADTMHRWLESGDARLIAWASFHAANHVPVGSRSLPSLRSHMMHLAETYEVLSSWDAPVDYTKLTKAQRDHSTAMLSVLNAMMTLRMALPPDEAMHLYPEFGAVTLVLMRNVCGPDGAACDAAWMRVLQGNAPSVDRVAAADVLSGRVPPGYVSELLKRVYFQVDLTVSDDGVSTQGLGSSTIGDCGMAMPKLDWPPVQQFYLYWDKRERDAVPFLAGPVPVFLEPGQCGAQVPASLPTKRYETTEEESRFLWRLVQEALGGESVAMPLKLRTTVPLRWVDAQHFRSDVDAIYRQHRAGLNDLLEMLVAKGLLTRAEVLALADVDAPEQLQLRFSMFDDRPENAGNVPVPGVRFHDPHVLWSGPATTWVSSAY